MKEPDKVREAFIKNSHTRFKKGFSGHLPFGTKDAYVREIMAADLSKLASLMMICGFLMQTKAVFLAEPDFKWLRRAWLNAFWPSQ